MSTSSTAPGLLRWRQQSNPERVELYIKSSMYFAPWLVVSYPVGLLLGTGGGFFPVLYLVAAIAQATAATFVLRGASEIYLGTGDRLSLFWLIALGVSTAGCVALAALLPAVYNEPVDGMALPISLALACACWALSPLWNANLILYVGLGLTVVFGILTGLTSGVPVLAAMVWMAMFVLIALTMRASVWMIGSIREQVRLAEVEARVAVAEERWRISRDLHDVFGRTLSVVAIKSEVAAALARRGDERGVAEMLEVQRLAHEGLAEVRALVQGYRRAELAAELAGAREFLGAAGIGCRLVGVELELPEQVQESAAWVVREGVTNVVRHSKATQCTIEVSQTGGGWLLQISNDGVTEQASGSGSGLSGLAERLLPRGGQLSTKQTGKTFTLTASLKGES